MMILTVLVAIAFLYSVVTERKSKYSSGEEWGWRTSILANTVAFGFVGAVLAVGLLSLNILAP